jgi:hypothetical protein
MHLPVLIQLLFKIMNIYSRNRFVLFHTGALKPENLIIIPDINIKLIFAAYLNLYKFAPLFKVM